MDALQDACDTVAITSETLNHVDLVAWAVARGCDRIHAAMEQTGVSFMQSLPNRLNPVNHEFKRLVDDGEFGRITLM